MRRLTGVFVFAASGIAFVACAEVSGLNDFSKGTGDASAPLKTTTTPEASPLDEPEVAADDESDANEELSSDGDDGASADDSDLEADAPGASDAGSDTGDDDHADADAESTEPPEGGGSDAAPSDGGNGDPSPDASDGACQQYLHQNGMGQTYTDCTPPLTYDETEATKACTAANAGACAMNGICIGGGAVCTTTTLPCECWAYAGSTAGHANKSLAGPVCGCPGAGDPLWQ